MRYFLIAGERSGDLHGANLIKAIARQDPNAIFVGIGGDSMDDAGMRLLLHYRSMSYMGVVEILKHLPEILGNLRKTKWMVANEAPDVLILIDFAAFNMKIARHAKKLGLKVAYYISPKVWAWNERRVKDIIKYVHKLLCILPFEVSYFAARGYEAVYVGNPVMEHVLAYQPEPLEVSPKGRSVAILPGSRSPEVQRARHVIRDLAALRSEWTFLVAGVTNLDRSAYAPLESLPNVEVYFDRTYDLLKAADVAVVTSGTATLETALLGVPQVVCYRTSALTYQIIRRMIQVPYISLVNLIAGKMVVPELVQQDFHAERILRELDQLLPEGSSRTSMLNAYESVKEILGDQSASQFAATEIIILASSRP